MIKKGQTMNTKKEQFLPDYLKADLENQIKLHGLVEYHSDLIEMARPKLSLILDHVLDEIPLGISRIGGAPDVSLLEEWRSPKTGKYNVFYLQVNLNEVPNSSFYKLPKSGLLSLYTDNQNMVGNGPILIFNQDVDNLKQFPLPTLGEYCDEDLSENHLPACQKLPKKFIIKESIWLSNEYPPDSIYDAGGEIEEAYFHLLDHYNEGIVDMCTPDSSGDKSCLFRLYGSEYFEFGDCGTDYISAKQDETGFNFTEISEWNHDY